MGLARPMMIATAAVVLIMVTVLLGITLGVQTRQQFREINSSWTNYFVGAERKGILISTLREHLGYGGIIHNFKNYVLRKESDYLAETRRQIDQFNAVIDEFKTLDLLPEERAALATILGTIRAYEANLRIAEKAAREGWEINRTDRLVRIDDTVAIGAIGALEQIWRGIQTASTKRIVRSVEEGQKLILIGFFSLAALALAAGIIGFLIYMLIQSLRDAIAQLKQELNERRRLQRSESRLATVVEQSPATIVITDTNERIQYVNTKFEDLTGWHRREVVGRTPAFLQSGKTTRATYDEMRQNLQAGQSWTGVFLNRKKDGGEYWVETTILPLIGSGGTIQNFIATGEDVTERRHAREQVARAQKLEVVGQLSGGIAHDFNNVLTTIVGSAHLASMDVDPGSDLAGEIEQIDIAAHRAKSLVQELLTFARREPGQLQTLDLAEIVDEVLRLLKASIPPTIGLDCETNTQTLVLADPTHLHQILMNLCRNAAEAIGGDDGQISVRFGAIDELNGLPSREDGWVHLEVVDDGPGISKEISARLFEPFFTTKPLGKGAGLGLAVVQGLVDEIGGQISVESTPGHGTRFELMLPGSSGKALDESRIAKELPKGRETILLVDDDIEVIGTLRRLLLRLGYRVDAFSSPIVALERFRKNPNRFDIVLTDILMPDMGGEALVAAIRELRPEIPVLFCTGYKPVQIAIPGTKPEILSKPVDPTQLALRIRRLLDTAS